MFFWEGIENHRHAVIGAGFGNLQLMFWFQKWQSFIGEREMLGCLGDKLESFGFEAALSGAAAAEFSGLCRCRSDGIHQRGAQGAFF